jgi:hypothetical protein
MKMKAIQRVICGTLAAVALPAAADDTNMPQFRPGLWQLERTVEMSGQPTQKLAVKDCMDPTAHMKKQNAMLTKAGCKFSATTKSGNSYSFTAECDIPNVGKSVQRSVLTAQSDSHYTIQVESEGKVGGQPVKSSEKLVAERAGDCSK